MRYKSRRGIGELILLVFMSALALYTLYLNIFKDYHMLLLTVLLAAAALAQGALYYFRPEYELTEDALLIHEKKPLKDRQIAYADVVRYRILGHRLGGLEREREPKDILLVYRKGQREKSEIISPEEAGVFAEAIGKILG